MSEFDVVHNEYLPQCWACGEPVNKHLLFSDEKYERGVSEIWSDKKVTSKLQRCHIVPKQFGGEDTPDNLFLLCEHCHEESPDTRNKRAFFRWVYRRRKEYCYGLNFVWLQQEIQQEIQQRGHDVLSFLREFYDVQDSVGYSDFVNNALSRCGTHGVFVQESSVVVCLVDEMERIVLQKRKAEILDRESELSQGMA